MTEQTEKRKTTDHLGVFEGHPTLLTENCFRVASYI